MPNSESTESFEDWQRRTFGEDWEPLIIPAAKQEDSEITGLERVAVGLYGLLYASVPVAVFVYMFVI